ncbi:zinc finger protein 2-like [Argiope bruennichi]|uniref:zinc finger protein 2-like n=1 Tax=Argiope bruennichi TaxID=94029 RepID=UPI002494EC63|nr:zinc finger protein 2-like [Argiope bruennichi]
MEELRCLNCNKPFDTQQGHVCLNNPWMLGNQILQDIEDELLLHENEFISLDSEQLPELSSVCSEIFNRISDPYTDPGVSKEETFGTDQQIGSRPVSLALPELSSVCNEIFNRSPDHCSDSSLSKQVTSGANQEIGSNPVSFSEKSETFDKCTVNAVNVVPGPSRLLLNESEESLCQEEFQPIPYHAVSTKVKQWTCSVCRKVYKDKYRLKSHMQFHGGEKKHRCEFCGKLFHQKSDLQKHVRLHTGEKPFSCDVCGKRFRISPFLKSHMLSHDGKKQYRCGICGKSYVHKSSLNTHVRSHRDEKLFACDLCWKGYKQKGHLTRHYRISHIGNKFSCQICGKLYTEMHSLKRHACKHEQ